MKESVQITEEVTKEVIVSLTRQDILSLLKDDYLEKDLENAVVFMRVPDGVNWSNGELDIDEPEGGLFVRFVTITRTMKEQ